MRRDHRHHGRAPPHRRRHATDISGQSAVTSAVGQIGFDNTGDTITLREESGTTVDQVTYGREANADAARAGCPDYGSPFVVHTSSTRNTVAFSPGRSNDGDGTPPAELTGFTTAAVLRWHNADETNNSGFDVQMDCRPA